jgi:hypothetical protein
MEPRVYIPSLFVHSLLMARDIKTYRSRSISQSKSQMCNRLKVAARHDDENDEQEGMKVAMMSQPSVNGFQIIQIAI